MNNGETLVVSSGDALTVTGNASIAPLTLDGMLTVDGNLSATGYNDSFTINGGTLTAGSLTTLESSFNLSADAALSVTGNVSDSYYYSNYHIVDSTFTVGGTFISQNDYIYVLNGGSVQLAQLTGTDVYLAVEDSSSSLEIGTAGGVAAGGLTIDSGVTTTVTGHFTAPSIIDNGTLVVAASGTLTLDGSLGGGGAIQIGSAGNLIVENDQGQPAASSSPTITFEGSDDALTIYGNALNASNAFVPVLIGLNGSDVIDYHGTVTSATPSYNGTNTILTLYDGSTAVATLTLQGDYSSDTFYAGAVSSGVTQIGVLSPGDTATPPAGTSTADQYVWASVAGSWDNAGNWNDTTASQTPAL